MLSARRCQVSGSVHNRPFGKFLAWDSFVLDSFPFKWWFRNLLFRIICRVVAAVLAAVSADGKQLRIQLSGWNVSHLFPRPDGAYSDINFALQNAPDPSRILLVPEVIDDPVGEFNAPIIQRVPDPSAVVVADAGGPGRHEVDEAPGGDPVDASLEGGSSTGLSISTREAHDSGIILASVLEERASDNVYHGYAESEDYGPSDEEDDDDEADDEGENDEADDDADSLEQLDLPEIREEFLMQEQYEAEELSYRQEAEELEPQEVAREAVVFERTQADDEEHVNTMLQRQVSRARGDAQYILSSAPFEPKSDNTVGPTSAQVISHVLSILEPITLSQDVQEDKYALKERLMPVKNDSSESSAARSPTSSSSSM
ncbi:hypothetical protein KC19_1G024800 [Ceratodon purpureus]|uniref:Uncharacterized protein n=1 Tax=Ceratodon purpureus TaxID=3225 RepID=A0A8T0J2Q4_CERPU|nr:hypothetical protein KC19_1G024800 [Ceratodon purpureus]